MLRIFTLTFLLLATRAFAQLPQGLGAADPSQQLKTTGMSLWGHSSQRPVLTSAPLYTISEGRQPRMSRAQRARAKAKAKARARRARRR